MNALARHYVGQEDTCGQHSHPHLTMLRLRTLFFNHLQCIGPAVMGDDDSLVSHEPLAPLLAYNTGPLELVEQNSFLD